MGKLSQIVFFKTFFVRLYRRFMEDRALELAAQLAYFFLLSLFPFLIFTFSILSYLGITGEQMLPYIEQFAPPDVFDIIKNNLNSVLSQSGGGGVLSVSALIAIWSASTAVVAIIRTMNRAYNVEEGRPFILTRLTAIALTFAVIFVIIMALVLNVFGPTVGKELFHYLGIPENIFKIWDILRLLISFLIIIVVFACLYCFAPNKQLHFSEVIVGAVLAAVLWQCASLAFSYYVEQFGQFSATYGTLQGIIILMIWFYLTGLTIIIGGEINAVLRQIRRHG
ncbi:YihY/virulence factor BrkB family protein [Tuberibacillus sp. Marseille-P3662]|uniref:YihY/virulence factor BrkB family protein n=1 Tax=Tuberibacillus sp. Marseille-P3662 TaxID=1965358 RepID=UPI000A1C8622|nr:YihY/virulence factor BrkB family protein [Tuberibacillus sp. Marseille-P3662]